VSDETTWLSGFSVTQRFDFDLYEVVYNVCANKINSIQNYWQNKVFLHLLIQVEHETKQAASTNL